MKQHGGGRGLDGTRRRLERWREMYGGPGRMIPEELWAEAAAIARVEGVNATARALRLDPRRLRRRMESCDAGSAKASEGFVEVDARGLCSPGRMVLRFEGRDGERLVVELSGASACDVAELARLLWSRPS
jgi:hypothetical protein